MERFDEIERLRTEYLRELTALAKMLIALASGALTLLLSPSGIALSIRAGSHVTVTVWGLLATAAVLGFVQVFVFSSRFKSRADYLNSCLLVETLLAVKATDEHLNKFLLKHDKHKTSYDQKFTACVLLVLCQGLFLLVTFALLAYPILGMVVSGTGKGAP